MTRDIARIFGVPAAVVGSSGIDWGKEEDRRVAVLVENATRAVARAVGEQAKAAEPAPTTTPGKRRRIKFEEEE